MITEDALAVAVEIVTTGGALASAAQEGVRERRKDGMTSLAGAVVTDVDMAVERFVDDELARRCPDDGLVGEEYADRVGTTGRTWFVDPVDGTLNFARRLGPWSVVLSAWQDDQPELVAVWSAGQVWTAVRGGGAHLDGAPLHLADEAEPQGLVHVPPVLAAAAREPGWLPRTIESSAVQMCQVADGRVNGTVRLGGARHDMHGPALIVAEAGGTVTDLDGGAWSAASTGIVAARRGAHAGLLALA